jgi:L-arabonate dehydrase
MLTGRFRGKTIGTSDVWRFNDAVRSGDMSQEELTTAEAAMCRSQGHCAVMGTASTMACMVEALGLTLPENAAIPAADSRRKVLAQFSGRRIVDMVREDLKLSDILTREAFENAIMVNAAVGGSTNFVLHLLAIAGRIGVDINLDDFDRLSRNIPLLANLQPSGEYFMEDFYYAGGLPAVMNALQTKLHVHTVAASGKAIEANYREAICYDEQIIGSMDKAFKPVSGIAVLRGNLCADGAVLKPSAASSHLMKHRGQALVFQNIEDYHTRIDEESLPVTKDTVLVLKNVGPVGYPGMPEVGNMALPRRLLEQGVTDVVRISDGRMSGTGFGTVVLHVSPESAIGGNLALVEDGDWIELDMDARSLQLMLSEEELTRRRAAWKPDHNMLQRGYVGLYQQQVQQAHQGADMAFLLGGSGSVVTRDSH